MTHVIYKLTSPKGKFYIGRTNNFGNRMKEHKYEAMTRKTIGSLYNAIRYHGWENFTKEIVAEVPTEEAAVMIEESLIQTHDTVKNGYNDTYMGSGGDIWQYKTPEQKEEFRKQMSELTTGENNGMYGKKHSDDAKAKQKAKAKGRFSLPWYIERNGEEEGTRLYNERCEFLRNRKMTFDANGNFAKKENTAKGSE